MVANYKDLNQYSEPKAQRWRVIAEVATNDPNNRIALVCLGSSITQVRENYQSAFYYVLSEEVRKKTKRLIIQRFDGLPDCGHWVGQNFVPIPKSNKK